MLDAFALKIITCMLTHLLTFDTHSLVVNYHDHTHTLSCRYLADGLLAPVRSCLIFGSLLQFVACHPVSQRLSLSLSPGLVRR